MSQRLDVAVAARFRLTRTKAAAVIMAGEITVDGQPARKPGQSVPDGAALERDRKSSEVSRAAGKLAGALDRWPLDLEGKIVLDVGASTGGFTQTTLERGARHVYAVDVGHGQLAWPLQNDDRVTNLERTDIRKLEPAAWPKPPDLAVADVSFISLRQVLPSIAGLLRPGADVVALFKPQFEVGQAIASKHRGVIRDPQVIETALTGFIAWLGDHDWTLREQVESSVVGTKGNRERVVWLVTPR